MLSNVIHNLSVFSISLARIQELSSLDVSCITLSVSRFYNNAWHLVGICMLNRLATSLVRGGSAVLGSEVQFL